jgi:hypothetical protein
VFGAWAERERKRRALEKDMPEDQVGTVAKDSPRGLALGRMGDCGVVIGSGASLPNAVFNLGSEKESDKEPLIDVGSKSQAAESLDKDESADHPHHGSPPQVTKRLDGLVMRVNRTTRYGESHNIEFYHLAAAELWISNDPWGREESPGDKNDA